MGNYLKVPTVRRIFISVTVISVTLFGINSLINSAGSSTENNAIAENRSGALMALNSWAGQRAYPGNATPSGGFYEAFNTIKKMEQIADKHFIAPDPWESIGPDNRGGRTNALAVDPGNTNVVYAGGATGGLWRLTQSGSDYDWEFIETGFPVLGIMAIAIHPQNSNIIYIGTGEVYQYGNSIGGLYQRSTRGSYGIGVLKTTDRGVTWTKSIDWSYNQERGVQALEVHPTNPDIVFAGTSEGLYRTLDGGANWEQVHNVIMVQDIDINPANPDIVFISSGNQGSSGSGIYRSMTGGAAGTWQKLAGGLPGSWGGKTLLDIYQASPNIIYADVANGSSTIGLFMSDDNGETWTNLDSQDKASYQGWFAHYVRVHPTDNSRILMAGVEFYSSTNGGSSFNILNGMHVDHHCFANHPTDPDIVYFGNDGGVYRSDDGGLTFSGRSNGYVTTQFYNGFSSSPTNPDHAAGGLQDNGCVRYRGSTSWSTLGCGGDGTFTAINPLDDDIMYASSQNLFIRISRNGGQSMSNIQNGLSDGSSAFISPFVIAPSQPTTLYGGKSFLYKTVNEGSSWQKMNGGDELNGNPILALGVSPTNHNVVYAATAPGSSRRARVFASTDGGVTVTDVTGNLPDRYYIDVAVSPHNEEVVYVTLSGFGSSHLYRSPDGGTSWQDVGTGLPDVPTSAFIEDPENRGFIYVGNDLGVFASLDDGATWYPYKVGMPTAAMVMDLSISISNRQLRAVTHGNGVYERPLLNPGDVRVHSRAHMSSREFWNYPNPFKDRTTLQFHFKEPNYAKIEIVDVRGNLIRNLFSGHFPAGTSTHSWDATGESGNLVARGRYYARLITSTGQKTITLQVK